MLFCGICGLVISVAEVASGEAFWLVLDALLLLALLNWLLFWLTVVLPVIEPKLGLPAITPVFTMGLTTGALGVGVL